MGMDADSNEEGRKDESGAPDYDATGGYGAADYDEPGYAGGDDDYAGDDTVGFDAVGYADYEDARYEAAGYEAAGSDSDGYDDGRDGGRDFPAAGRGAPAPYGDDWDPRRDTYWRRRFLILCGGAVALGVCAFLFPGAHSAPAKTSPAARASVAAQVSAQALPPAATGNPWGVEPSAQPGPTATAAGLATAPAKFVATAKPAGTATKAKEKVGTAYHPSTSPTGSAKATPTGKATGLPRATGPARVSGPAKGAGSGAPEPQCAPSDIVLSLFTSQPAYAGGARPAFRVYAVSTSAKACTLRYGPGSVKVVVKRGGRVVWDSAACRPPAAKPLRFTLGVPRVLTLSWNRKAAGPGGCAGALPSGATGTLHAVAMRGGQSSPAATFKVTR